MGTYEPTTSIVITLGIHSRLCFSDPCPTMACKKGTIESHIPELCGAISDIHTTSRGSAAGVMPERGRASVGADVLLWRWGLNGSCKGATQRSSEWGGIRTWPTTCVGGNMEIPWKFEKTLIGFCAPNPYVNSYGRGNYRAQLKIASIHSNTSGATVEFTCANGRTSSRPQQRVHLYSCCDPCRGPPRDGQPDGSSNDDAAACGGQSRPVGRRETPSRTCNGR